jgi:hypothetical protein
MSYASSALAPLQIFALSSTILSTAFQLASLVALEGRFTGKRDAGWICGLCRVAAVSGFPFQISSLTRMVLCTALIADSDSANFEPQQL